MNNSSLTFKNGVKDGLPISLAYLSVSFAFGVQASLLGVPVIISVLISMTNLTSAGQLAGLGVVAALGSFMEIAVMQLVINSRYFIMSIALSQKTDDSFTVGRRLLCAAFITDEIFALAAAKPRKISVKYFYGLALLPYIGWATGTLIDAVFGNVLPDNAAYALGIALYAMFIAIILPPSLSQRGVLAASLLGAGLSCALYYVPWFKGLSSGMSVIVAALAASFVVAAIFPVNESENENSADKAEATENPNEEENGNVG